MHFLDLRTGMICSYMGGHKKAKHNDTKIVAKSSYFFKKSVSCVTDKLINMGALLDFLRYFTEYFK